MFGFFKTKDIRYGDIAVLIRFGAARAATRCDETGHPNDSATWNAALLEFLNFYSTIACNEISRKLNSASAETITDAFMAILRGFIERPPIPHEPPGLYDTVRRAYNELKLDGKLFMQYWSGDLSSLITSTELDQMRRIDMPPPNQSATGIAYYALLVRVVRIYNRGGCAFPPVMAVAHFDKTIRGVSQEFLDSLKQVMNK